MRRILNIEYSILNIQYFTFNILLLFCCAAAIVLALIGAASHVLAAADGAAVAGQALADSGLQAGLCVHLGTTDGEIEAELAAGGRRLVHGLALDDTACQAARGALQARGIYGLASVERAASLDVLPYAANLVNLLVADLDALGARSPPQAEILRVLAPGGAACLKTGGRWAMTAKPRPREMDEWTHFDYGPEGNGVSRDRLVRPATFIQWISSAQPVKLGGNPAGFRVFTGPRVAGGRIFYEWGAEAEKGKREQFYCGRDAFSGVVLWNVRNTAPGRKDWQFVADGRHVYTFMEKGGPLAALDAGTGRVVRTYEQGGRLTDDWRATALRLCGGTLLLATGSTLYALDSASGALRWRHEEADAGLAFPCASAAAGRVFVAVCEPAFRGASRWPVARAKAILALNLASGKPIWRSADVEGAYVGQLVYDNGNLALFASGAISGGEEPFIGNMRAGDGKLLWRATFTKQYNRFGYNLLVRDGVMYYADAWRIYAHNMQTGEETRPYDDSGYNMRCNRFCATGDYFIYGLVAYVDRGWKGLFQSITRSGCAIGATPACGMTYFTPNACGCITEVRGHLALSSEPLREPVPDAARLESGPAAPAAVPIAAGAAIAVPAAPRAAAPAGPVAEDWLRHERASMAETAPVAAGGRTYAAVVHEHRLECRDAAGKALWTFTAGGRITGPPLVDGGLCFFGSHDGYVYCVKAGTGERVWRFLAAPYERKMTVAGQLESSWPVFGVAMHQGALCFSAGYHPEVGGGIYIYGLDPATGKLAWEKVVRRAPVAYDGKGRYAIKPNRVLNDCLASDGEALSLPGIRFAPQDADAEIQKKVDGEIPPPPKPKKG